MPHATDRQITDLLRQLRLGPWLDRLEQDLDAATADAVLHAVLERAADRSLLWITHRPEELAAFPEVHHLGADP